MNGPRTAQEFLEAFVAIAPACLADHEAKHGPGPWVLVAADPADTCGRRVLHQFTDHSTLDDLAQKGLAATAIVRPDVAADTLREAGVPADVRRIKETRPGRFYLVTVSHGRSLAVAVLRQDAAASSREMN
jgi:hypothetical protein